MSTVKTEKRTDPFKPVIRKKDMDRDMYNDIERMAKECVENPKEKFKDEMYKKRNEQTIVFLKINEDNFLKIQSENNKRDIEKEENRKKDLEISLKQKRRNVNSEACEHMVKLIIDIVDEAHVYQQINDAEEIDDRVWREWTNIFINDQSVLDKEEEPKEINQEENKEKEDNEQPQEEDEKNPEGEEKEEKKDNSKQNS